MVFNIYYINFPKVYEIKMMLSNIISTGKEITQEDSKEKEKLSLKLKRDLIF